MTKKKIIIYTDGACSGNPGLGGWGAVLIHNNTEKEIYGHCQQTTNNQMEMMAAIQALKTLKESCTIELFTDSNYLKNGITSWIHNWKKKNWKTASGKPVKNLELWEELDNISKNHEITWRWVKGHNGNEGNEKADSLANKAIDEARNYLD